MRQPVALAALAVLLVVGVFACGDSSTGPTQQTTTTTSIPVPQIPTVSGNYSGTATLQYPELHTTVGCPATATVTQSGSTVSIGTIAHSGSCSGIGIPMPSLTIDTNGAFQSGTTSYFDTSCGSSSVAFSGGFGSNSLALNLSISSNYCYNINYSVTMLR